MMRNLSQINKEVSRRVKKCRGIRDKIEELMNTHKKLRKEISSFLCKGDKVSLESWPYGERVISKIEKEDGFLTFEREWEVSHSDNVNEVLNLRKEN